MVYEFAKDTMKTYGRPVTTGEVINHTKDGLPMCADLVANHLLEIHPVALK